MLTGPPPKIHGTRDILHTWGAIQHGLNELLLSPAIKRRAGIELKPSGVDADADAVVAMTGKYRQMLKSV
jgi:hypothetical protein